MADGRDPKDTIPKEEAEGGEFGRMGGSHHQTEGYGEMAAKTADESPSEEAGAGSYGAEYPEEGEESPGGYGRLAHPDEDAEKLRSDN